MKKGIDRDLLIFYLVLGIGYFIIGSLNTVHKYPDHFSASIFNNLWGIIYLLPVNFIFFEFSFPFVLRKRKYLIYNILLGILILWVHLILWSYGSYAWRLLGIQAGVYTPLRDFTKV